MVSCIQSQPFNYTSDQNPLQKLQQMFHKNMNSWEEFEGDDNVFYAEIRRQVMQLIAEDEDEDDKNKNKERGSKQNGFSVLQPGFQFNWTGLKDGSRVPEWMVELWRKENRDGGFSGTGVFIPHIVKSKRRHKPRRKNNGRERVYKPVTKVN